MWPIMCCSLFELNELCKVPEKLTCRVSHLESSGSGPVGCKTLHMLGTFAKRVNE